jgi:LuxR family maltose regulon positive regulatory protein
MNNSHDKALVLVSAPAGFGKTTLLAEWAAQADLTLAWLSLDEGDNDPNRFLRYVIAALNNAPAKTESDLGPGSFNRFNPFPSKPSWSLRSTI